MITIKVDTSGYGGEILHKTIHVMTNDPRKPETKITISGRVKNFVAIKPKVVKLYGPVGESLKKTVKIVPVDNYPFKIIETKAQIGKNIRYQLAKEIRGQRIAYCLTVHNLMQNKGVFYDTIYLITDSRIKPRLYIPIFGKISEPTTEK
jgi:hypothetical protein